MKITVGTIVYIYNRAGPGYVVNVDTMSGQYFVCHPAIPGGAWLKAHNLYPAILVSPPSHHEWQEHLKKYAPHVAAVEAKPSLIKVKRPPTYDEIKPGMSLQLRYREGQPLAKVVKAYRNIFGEPCVELEPPPGLIGKFYRIEDTFIVEDHVDPNDSASKEAQENVPEDPDFIAI